jgi:PIN domain nuclease of toxin-antitoxin system
VLDAWALIAFLDDERPASAQVEAILGNGAAAACSINLGEVLYRQIRTAGATAARDGVTKLRGEMTVLDPDWDLVVSAAKVKANGGLSYADAFCVATALRLEAELWTGDPEIIDLAGRLQFEVRDLRP